MKKREVLAIDVVPGEHVRKEMKCIFALRKFIIFG